MDIFEYADNLYVEEMQKSLTKMQKFLIDKGIASSFKEVKELPRIEINGFAKNGYERLIIEDIWDNYDINTLECSNGFNTYYPIVRNGVIKFPTKTNGNYYTVFSVIAESTDEYDLRLSEYVYYSDIFYLNQVFLIRNISKKAPMQPLSVRRGTINEFFFGGFSKKELSEFSRSELNYIRDVNCGNDNAVACVSQVIGAFRVINFLYERHLSLGFNIQNNEYFSLKNWIEDSIHTSTQMKNKELDEKEEFLEDIIKADNGIQILKEHSVEYFINEIVHRTNSHCLLCAVGFAFKSGLELLSSSFDQVKQTGHKAEIIVGALQHYNNVKANNRIDKQTVALMNTLLTQNRISLYTYEDAFYHGKFYYMSNKEKAYIITGSTNISKSAFRSNIELDVIYITDLNSPLDIQFREWYSSLKDRCTELKKLNVDYFAEYNWDSELDAFGSLKNRIISNSEARNRIDQLTDEETKYRLNIWMDKNPTSIYDEIEIEAFKDDDYSLFYYSSEKLAVFESFKPNNAYYVFKIKSSLADLMNNISHMTKEGMSNSECYIRKGYHTLSHDNLKIRINNFFNK